MLGEYLNGIIEWVLSLIHAYGPYSVFLAVFLEELLLPVPAPVVIMGASFILVPQGLPFWDAVSRMLFLIVLPAAIASTIGSYIIYSLGYYGGRPVIGRFHKFLKFSWLDIRKIEGRLERGRTWTTIAVLRAIPFFPVAFVSFLSGVLRLSWKKFGIATFIGSVPRNFILAFAGWQLGSAYIGLAKQLGLVENIVAVVLIALLAYFLYRFRHKYAHHYRRILRRNQEKPSG